MTGPGVLEGNARGVEGERLDDSHTVEPAQIQVLQVLLVGRLDGGQAAGGDDTHPESVLQIGVDGGLGRLRRYLRDDLGEEDVAVHDGRPPVEQAQTRQGESAGALGQAGPAGQVGVDGHHAGLQQPGAHLDAQPAAGLGQRFDAGQQEVGRLMMLAEDDLDSPALHRLNISLARQVLERLAHGVAGDPEVVGQGVLRWQEGQERVLAPFDACAQRRVDLLVLRRGHVPPPSRPALIGQPVIG